MVDGSRSVPVAAWGALLLVMSVAMPVRGWSAPAPPATRPEDRVIFDQEATRKWMGREAPGEFWTPALADVLALEEKLPAYLREQYKNRRKEPLWKRAPRYKRQYFGITRHGERVIYANFFCALFSNAEDWHHVPVGVDDGGDCYFSIEYDVKRGTFHDFVVNGKA